MTFEVRTEGLFSITLFTADRQQHSSCRLGSLFCDLLAAISSENHRCPYPITWRNLNQSIQRNQSVHMASLAIFSTTGLERSDLVFIPSCHSFLVAGGCLEFAMIHWTVGETNFYGVLKRRLVEEEAQKRFEKYLIEEVAVSSIKKSVHEVRLKQIIDLSSDKPKIAS